MKAGGATDLGDEDGDVVFRLKLEAEITVAGSNSDELEILRQLLLRLLPRCVGRTIVSRPSEWKGTRSKRFERKPSCAFRS